MSDLLEQIAIYISELGIEKYSREDVDGTIFLEMLPDNPDKCIGIFVRGGNEGDVNGEVSEANIQFIVRDNDKLRALDTGFAIIKKLCGFNSESLTPNGYYIIDTHAPQGMPIYLNTDQSGRHEYSINFIIEFDIREEK